MPPGDPARRPARRRAAGGAHNWFDRFRHLPVRWEPRGTTYPASVQLAAVPIIYRELRHARSLSGQARLARRGIRDAVGH